MKVLGTTLGALDGLSLGTYYGTELGWLESSTDRAADGKPKGLLLSACLVGSIGLLLVPFFPVFGYSTKFSDGLPCNCNRCPRNSCPCLLLFPSSYEEGIVEFLPCSLKSLL